MTAHPTRRPTRRGDAPLLLATADEDLIATLLPLTAAADVTPVVARDPVEALAGWMRAPVALIGPDLAPDLLKIAFERRPHAYLVTQHRAPDELFRVAVALGVEQVVELPGSSAWLVEQLADLTEHQPSRGEVIGVIGGSGGAGATTLACALGQHAARDGETVVIDCDPQGPGLDRMLGLERTDGFRWDALCQTTGRLSARALRDALPRKGRLGVLSWYVDGSTPRLQAFAVREALSAARRGHRTVVVDLPRSADALIDEVATRCDRLLLVTVASVAGVAAATRMRARFSDHPRVEVVIRGEALTAADVGAAVRAPVAVQMRDQRGLEEAIDLGLGPLRTRRGPLARAAGALLGPQAAEGEAA